MIEKIGPIKNPLTIIAIFAAIAEISGTTVLPFIAPTSQATYVWFLIVFPILLIVLFFATLNFNHKVLYAPSDYQNEDNFLRSLPRATIAEKVLKIEAEIAEEAAAEQSVSGAERSPPKITDEPATIEGSPISYQRLVRRSAEATYMLVEELVFRKLSREFSAEIQRGVRLGSPGARYIFDGIVHDRGVTTVIEVKFFRHAPISNNQINQLRQSLKRIQESVQLLPTEQSVSLRVLLIIAGDEDNAFEGRVTAQIDRYRSEFAFPIEVRFYSLTDLEREFDLVA